jgi:Tfp pilus assembly protein PilX
MITNVDRLRGEQGMILISSLAILSILLMVGIGSRVMLHNDYRVLTNLRGGTEAFYVSVAGLEWGKNTLAQSATFPPAPANGTASFANGQFSISFDPPTVAGSLSAKIVVHSVGTLGSASQTVQAQLTKSYDLADAAIGLRGNGSQVILNGGALAASGLDHDPATGLPLAKAKARPAISAGDESLRALVDQAAAGLPPGSLETDGVVTPVAASEYLPTSMVGQLANNLCALGGAIVSTLPIGGALTIENQTWGSLSTPQLRCIDGLPESGDAVTLAGNMTGAGVLIVRNADLLLTGSLRWDGLIIVTGNDVSLKVTGSSVKDVYGAVIVNEAGGASSKAILDVQGSVRLLFSRQALSQAAQLIPSSALTNIYTSLPVQISQDYWRTVTP